MANIRRRSRARGHDLSETEWAYLNDALTDDIGSDWERFGLEWECDAFQKMPIPELWKLYGKSVLDRWVKDSPGTRPALWWRFEAPRNFDLDEGDCYWNGKLPKPRHRLGGTGKPLHETLSYVPDFYLGVPSLWTLADGPPIDPCCVPIDDRNPPTFESQAMYLKRYGLMSEAEERRSSFEPESILDILEGKRSGQSDMQDRFGFLAAD